MHIIRMISWHFIETEGDRHQLVPLHSKNQITIS